MSIQEAQAEKTLINVEKNEGYFTMSAADVLQL